MKRILFFAFITLVIIPYGFSQYKISGRIIDADNKDPLTSAHILQQNHDNGGVSDSDGYFELNISERTGLISVKSVGYKTVTLSFRVKNEKLDMGILYLQKESVPLDEITISAGLVNSDKTPVTISTVKAKTIQNELGDRPLTFSMTKTPGVYSVRTGGGSGDAEISIRGFSQENVGVLLNGIPINGVENGLIYWSNWLGLTNAAAEIQIQKGPGFANASANSVGGSINIITDPAYKDRSGSIFYQVSSYGNQKITLALNSGKLKNGWNISLMGSYTRGPGYVDATYVRGWSYYLSLFKHINKKNKISITALGAPQRHGQRTLKLTDEENSIHGNLFNKDWGSMDGKLNNASENFYHRPFVGINHHLQIDDTKKITNSVYLIVGNGGGKWSESFNYAPSIFQYRTTSGQIDWPTIYENNALNEDTYTLENGNTVSGYSVNVQTHFLASHVQTGFMSNYKQKLTKYLEFVAGIHYRYFNSYLREEIIDLLGGNFFIEDYGWAVDGVSGREQIKTVGDVIKVDNNSIINYANAFAQLLFERKKWNAFFSIHGNSNWYQRIDHYNYISDTKSEVITKPGFDLRTGVSFKPGIRHNVYLNGAYISKAPYFKYVFGNFTNVPVENLENEQIKTIEAGYKFENKAITANVNAYYTDWDNVSLLSDEYIQLENNKQSRAMINGLKALHMGIELNVSARIARNFSMGAILSIGNYKWKNDVSAKLFNNNNVIVDTVNVYAKDLYLGGTAQQQFGLFADVRILSFFNLKAEWFYYDKIYANFAPTSRNNPDDRSQPYQIPSYNNLNIHLGIPFRFFKQSGLLQINGYNLLNDNYIEWGEDGSSHDLNTFRGFWSFGRTFDFMLKLNF